MNNEEQFDNGYRRGLTDAIEILEEENSKPCNCQTCACDKAIVRIRKLREEE